MHRHWRERRAHRGELVQFDGSYHAWFEDEAGWTRPVSWRPLTTPTGELLHLAFAPHGGAPRHGLLDRHILPLVPPELIAKRVGERLRVKQRIPLDRLSTVGELSAWLADNATESLMRDHKWSREQIARVVKRITLAQLGDVPYGEDQRFVEDLGLN